MKRTLVIAALVIFSACSADPSGSASEPENLDSGTTRTDTRTDAQASNPETSRNTMSEPSNKPDGGSSILDAIIGADGAPPPIDTRPSTNPDAVRDMVMSAPDFDDETKAIIARLEGVPELVVGILGAPIPPGTSAPAMAPGGAFFPNYKAYPFSTACFDDRHSLGYYWNGRDFVPWFKPRGTQNNIVIARFASPRDLALLGSPARGLRHMTIDLWIKAQGSNLDASIEKVNAFIRELATRPYCKKAQ